MGIGAAVVGASLVGSIGGALISSSAAKSAANTQASAANRATDASLAEQAQVRSDLAPYNVSGQDAASRLASFTNGSDPTAELTALEGTPGYQFALTQGLKSTQNSAAARGLGTSGAALKGAAGFSTGLAQNTFQSNLLNPLQFQAGLGESAAAQTGTLGTQGVGQANQAAIGGANALAAGQVGSANAIAGGLNSAASQPLNYLLYSKLLGNNGAGAAGSGGSFWSSGATSSPASINDLGQYG